nr:HNH endonuclease signature motif containing protein [uncultured Dysosmobacter sp.]
MAQQRRADQQGPHRSAFEKNKKKIYATQTICGICGQPVDPSLKYPHPLARTVDHIIPIARGGHPSDLSNLQLAHWICNRQKSDLVAKQGTPPPEAKGPISNRVLPLSLVWENYRPK